MSDGIKADHLNAPGVDEGWRKLQTSTERDGSRGSLLLPSGTGWVEHDTLNVAQEVSRIWPNLRIAECKLRCDDCIAAGHAPYAVVELTRSGQTVHVMSVLTLDRRVIDTLHAMHADTANQEKLMEEHNARVKLEAEKHNEELRQSRLEIIQAALDSPKLRWKGPGGVTIDQRMTPQQARRALTQK